ncbi:hypothetical protein BN1708_020525 [Verticillium longisporum]|uniref:Uncharacterized protein n=1 Tax=Verticillium longisporum TaxID=100787 RepID=A0A0G4MWN0_VERLO|nr:hypothetical protein BN1708_020525 [Verticillium longisporum]
MRRRQRLLPSRRAPQFRASRSLTRRRP